MEITCSFQYPYYLSYIIQHLRQYIKVLFTIYHSIISSIRNSTSMTGVLKSSIMHALIMGCLCLNYALTKLSSGYYRLIFCLYLIIECVLLIGVLMSHYCSTTHLHQFRVATVGICLTQVINLIVSYEVKANETFLLITMLVISIFRI